MYQTQFQGISYTELDPLILPPSLGCPAEMRDCFWDTVKVLLLATMIKSSR